MSADPIRFQLIGQGPVALSLQLFARRAGVPTNAITSELNGFPSALTSPSLAARTIALSLGSWQLLGRIIELPPACPIREVEVSLQGSSGRTRITSAEMRTEALGYVTSYGSLNQALLNAAAAQHKQSNIERETADLRAAEQVFTSVTIHAEGNPGAEVDAREFEQHAVLAELSCPQMPAHCAFERFTADGPLALLPLIEPARFSLVWCCTPDQAERRSNIDEHDFVRELRSQVGPRLRNAQLTGTRLHSPLQRRQRKETVSANEVWIGNAAQSLHPVAGQGLNLGLRDSFELARVMAQLATRQPSADRLAIEQALRQYAQVRAVDRQRTVRLTDTLASVFTRTWMAPAQSLALALLDLTPTARGAFAGRLMFGNR